VSTLPSLLPGVAEVRGDHPALAPTKRIIHVLDWHYLPRDLFAVDLRAHNPGLSDAAAARAYRDHLDAAETVQGEQRELLAALAEVHGLRVVLVEGLTLAGLKAWTARVGNMKEAEAGREELLTMAEEARQRGRRDLARQAEDLLEQARRDRLELGAPGWLAMRGLTEVRPLDEQEALDGADPRRTGRKLDPAKVRQRQEGMVRLAVLAADPVTVLVLGSTRT
jgi:hypothetical protein